jgi:MoxR-like ATPase
MGNDANGSVAEYLLRPRRSFTAMCGLPHPGCGSCRPTAPSLAVYKDNAMTTTPTSRRRKTKVTSDDEPEVHQVEESGADPNSLTGSAADPDSALIPEAASAISLLTQLGVIGMGSIEPVILAALASGEPLLLIGPHGTAKSYLLNRIARALDLNWRHYNASLLNFDDLVGYPLPDEQGALRYLETPSSIWGAEAVFLDEISRCRVDLQNKLFPIIHERRVQGIELEQLVYRWSAMNPPATDDDDFDQDTTVYRGSEPLDPALADRFAFIVPVPGWDNLTHDEQRQVILVEDEPPTAEVSRNLARRIQAVRELIPALREEVGVYVCEYVRLVVDVLWNSSLELSPRRAGILRRNILAVHASRLLGDATADLSDSALLAVNHSIPQRASGVKVDPVRILTAHRHATSLVNLEPTDPLRIVLLETDPLRRALRAAAVGDAIPETEFSTIVADAIASLPPGGCHALAAELFESQAAGRLVAAVAEQCAALYVVVATPQETNTVVHAKSSRHRTWQQITATLASLKSDSPETTIKTNLLVGLFEANELQTEEDVERVLESWQAVRELVQGGVG